MTALPDSAGSKFSKQEKPAVLLQVLSKVARRQSAEKLANFFQIAADQLVIALQADQVGLFAIDVVKHQVVDFARSGPKADEMAIPSADEIMQTIMQFWTPDHKRLGAATPIIQAEREEYITQAGDHYQLTIPMRILERVNGILIVSTAPDALPPTEEELDTAISIASLLAVTIEQYRLTQAERQQRRQAEVLRELSRILTLRLQKQEVLELILDQLGRVIEYDSASIMLLDGLRLKIVANRKLQKDFGEGDSLALESLPHVREVIDQRKTVIISDVYTDPRWNMMPGTEYIRCWMGIPLIEKNHVIGLLNLDKEQPGFYAQIDANLAITFANQAAMAIENARLYEIERQQAEQLDALRATVADISTELELPRLLKAILQRATSLVRATGGDIGLYDENRDAIHILVSHNMGQDYQNTYMQPGEGAMGRAIQTRQPVLVADYATWENASPQYLNGQYHAALAMPLIFASRTVGAIGLMHSDPTRAFSSFDQHILSLFSQHAAIAIENARLFQEARRATDRRAILHKVSQQIVAANIDPEGIYTAVHQAAAQLMPAEAFVITRVNEANRTTDAVYLIDRSGRVPKMTVPIDEGLSGRVVRSGKPIYLEDLSDREKSGEVVHFGDPEAVRSAIAVPMFLGGRVVGMISSQSYQPRAFTQDDITLLEMLAAYAVVALENTRLLKEIQFMAVTDPLTQISNRRQLFDLGLREFNRSKRFLRSMSLVMLDIDHFKIVNDTYGHSVGDYVLYQLAQVLKRNVRDADIVGRYGGEEFVVILVETNLSTAAEAAERIRTSIHETFHSNDPMLPAITVSMGVAELTEKTPNFSALITNADTALYNAKNNGRDRVELY